MVKVSCRWMGWVGEGSLESVGEVRSMGVVGFGRVGKLRKKGYIEGVVSGVVALW